MADAIGQLGLDSGDFSRGISKSIEELKEMGLEVVGLNSKFANFGGAMLGVATVAGGALVAALKNAADRANDLETALTNIEKSDPIGTQLVGLGELQNRVKSIREELTKLDNIGVWDKVSDFVGSANLLVPFGGKGGGYDRVEKEQEEARKRLRQEEADALSDIASKERDQLEMLELKADGMNEEAEILKTQLQFREKIGAATKEGNHELAAILKEEEAITVEMIKQEAEKKKLLAELDLEEALAKSRRKELEDQILDGNKLYLAEEAKKKKAKEDALKSERDLEEDLAKQRKKDLEDQISAGNELYKQAQEKLKILKEIQAENEKITSELRGQSTMQEIQSSSERGIAQTSRDFDQRIAGQLERGNFEGAAELEFQKDNALRGDKVRRGNETASDRKAERKRKREDDRAIKRSDKRDADLERRLNQTIKDGLDPDQVPQDVKDFAKRKYDESINKIDKDKAKEDGGKQRAAWSQSDSQNLQKCAAALTPKD